MKPINTIASFKSRLSRELGFTVRGLGQGEYGKPITSPSGVQGYAVLRMGKAGGVFEVQINSVLKEPLTSWSGGESIPYRSNPYFVVEHSFAYYIDITEDKPGDQAQAYDMAALNKEQLFRDVKTKSSNLEKYAAFKTFIEKLLATGYFERCLDGAHSRYLASQKLKAEVIAETRKYLPNLQNLFDEYDSRQNLWFYAEPVEGKKTVPIINIKPHAKEDGSSSITIMVGKARVNDRKLIASSAYLSETYFYGKFDYIYTNELEKNGHPKSFFWKAEELHKALKALREHMGGTKKLLVAFHDPASNYSHDLRVE